MKKRLLFTITLFVLELVCMSKVTGPLMSLSARKTLASTITYQKRASTTVAYLKTAPGDKNPFTPSAEQLIQRQSVSDLVATWKGFSDFEKNEWELQAKAAKFVGTGYHYFLHKKGLPTVVPKLIRVVYLYPSDVSYNETYKQKIRQCALEVQSWYGVHAEFNKTFSLHNPIVEVYQTSHPDTWYPKGSADFFFAALADGYAMTGAINDDPDNRWIFIIDADSGGYSGASLWHNSVLNRMHLLRWIDPANYGWACGSFAHELGHDLGLPHPDPLDDSVMWTGLFNFPATYINTVDKLTLKNGDIGKVFMNKNY